MPVGSYRLAEPAGDLGTPVLLHGLTGFMDAGGSARLAMEHVLSSTSHRRLATFDIDEIFDYRARRPRTIFEADHYESISMPELAIDAATDEHGERFLILHGVEPDLGWSRVTDALVEVIRGLRVRMAVGVHAIPWPAPHSRPINVTMHANDASLLPNNRPWVGNLEVPGSLSALLEMRLGMASIPAMGFAAHIPHYLVQADFPRGALTLLQSVAAATGLALPLADLRDAAEESDADIAIQIASNAENMEAVASLESQHDALMAARASEPGTGPLSATTDDDIAAQIEAFLANLDGPGQ
jgi:hypothetical protein